MEAAGFVMGTDFDVGVDVRASELHLADSYQLAEGVNMSGEDTLAFYQGFCERHPSVIYIEDPFTPKDLELWHRLTTSLGPRVAVVADRLCDSDGSKILESFASKQANAASCKIRGGSTTSEIIDLMRVWKAARAEQLIISAGSGSTCGKFAMDLAVGCGAAYVKLGAPSRGEFSQLYNHLIEIEENLEIRDMLIPMVVLETPPPRPVDCPPEKTARSGKAPTPTPAMLDPLKDRLRNQTPDAGKKRAAAAAHSVKAKK